MKNITEKKSFLKRLVAATLLVCFMMAAAACGGKTKITVEVVSKDGSKVEYTVKTDKTTLYDALTEYKKITLDGYDSEWGFYITGVNGETADFTVDGSYWSLLINGEYAMTGISATNIEDGATYSLVYESFSADWEK